MNYQSIVNGITPVNEEVRKDAIKHLDNLIKPIGSLGTLETIAAQVAAIRGSVKNRIQKKCVVVMAADNGVCEEGVSACPQAITLIQSVNIVKGIAGIGVLSKFAGSDVRIVDIGIDSDAKVEGLIDKKIRKGTSNMSKGPAMSREEAIRAMEIGMEMVGQLAKEGYDLLGTGEMGIGNTSTSSAVLMSFTGCSADAAVGKGAGLTEEGYANKKAIIEKAIAVNRPDPKDPVDVLAKVGGFDIAGMAGCFLGAACHKIPIVIDGFISAVAAFIAYKINPLVKDYMIPSHCSAEPGYRLMMKELGLDPILNLNMRLGEGTGCPLAFKVIEASLAVISEMATFQEGSIVNDFMVDIR